MDRIKKNKTFTSMRLNKNIASLLLKKSPVVVFLMIALSCSAESKWPYLGNKIPRFIGITGGIEGFRSPLIQGGIGMNVVPTYIKRKIGGYIGFDLRYKRHLDQKNFSSYEINAGVFSGICFGLNLNYNYLEGNSTIGLKPFIGIGAYYFFLTYGYNIFSSRTNEIALLQRHLFNLHFMIPVYGFTKSGPSVYKAKRKQKDKKVVW